MQYLNSLVVQFENIFFLIDPKRLGGRLRHVQL